MEDKKDLAYYEDYLSRLNEKVPDDVVDLRVLEVYLSLQAKIFHDVGKCDLAIKVGNVLKRKAILSCQANNNDREYHDMYWRSYLLEAPYIFDSFLIYMEKNRPYEKRFYEPRRKTLKVVVDDLQDLYERKLKFLGVSLPARSGKSTLCIFYMAWRMGNRPNSHNAMGGHSGLLAKGFYGELLNLIDTPEYTYSEIFPELIKNGKLIQRQSADEYTINLGKPDRFATMTCRGIDGTWTGAIDVSWDGLLYIDDLIRDREHSLSPQRMENTYQEYLNKMVDRKSGFNPHDGTFAGAQELMVGTLWSVLDPLSRLEAEHGGDPLYRFRKIPALNDNDESNFDYEFNGFSTEYYKEMRERLDNAEWQAKYQQAPFVREGLLFGADDLRYFNGILPEGDSRVVAVIDVAWGGGDSLSMPIGREYDNGDVYIFDWVFNKGSKEKTVPLVCGKIMENEIRQVRCEGNVGGAMYSSYIDERLQQHNYKCNCTEKKAPTKMSKLEKIMAYSGDIKRKFIFLMPNGQINSDMRNTGDYSARYTRSAEYQAAMEELCMFVTVGRNPHDDAADGLTQLAMFVDNDNNATISAIKNPFWNM